MRLIDADKLKEDINSRFLTAGEKRLLCRIVDKAPTEFDDKAYSQGYAREIYLLKGTRMKGDADRG